MPNNARPNFAKFASPTGTEVINNLRSLDDRLAHLENEIAAIGAARIAAAGSRIEQRILQKLQQSSPHGAVMQRSEVPHGALSDRISALEGLFDLLSLRLSIAESSLEAAIQRIKLLQRAADQHILGI